MKLAPSRRSQTPASEDDIVRELGRIFGGAGSRRVASVGIGDDAAVLRKTAKPLVWTIDTSVEGVHFRRSWLSDEEIGWRSFHAAVSDLAAMGARPLAALSNLSLPGSARAEVALAIARGQARAARSLGCPVIGGNLSRAGEISVTTTALGTAARPLARSGARPGDELWLIGTVGLAAAGRHWLARSGRSRPSSRTSASREAISACVNAFRSPQALVREGMALVRRAHAVIDVSDGIAVDAERLARGSHVRVVVDQRRLEATLAGALLEVARSFRLPPLSLALGGGEDYALLAAGPGSRRPRTAKVIGFVERGRGARLLDAQGRQLPLGGGFDHFARRRGA